MGKSFIFPFDNVDPGATGTNIITIAQTATPNGRIDLAEIYIGSPASPNDATRQYDLKRITAENGTPGGTPITGNDTTGEGGSPQVDVRILPNAPTVGAIMAHLPIHQKNTYRWVGNPDAPFLAPASDDAGWTIQNGREGGTAFNISGYLIVREL
jgi:hypothetical protein